MYCPSRRSYFVRLEELQLNTKCIFFRVIQRINTRGRTSSKNEGQPQKVSLSTRFLGLPLLLIDRLKPLVPSCEYTSVWDLSAWHFLNFVWENLDRSMPNAARSHSANMPWTETYRIFISKGLERKKHFFFNWAVKKQHLKSQMIQAG